VRYFRTESEFAKKKGDLPFLQGAPQQAFSLD
jgi:hypothetical protein